VPGRLITQRSRVQVPPRTSENAPERCFLGAFCHPNCHRSRVKSPLGEPLAQDQLGHRHRRLAVHRRERVRVHVERERRRGVAESPAHDLRVDPGPQRRSRVGVRMSWSRMRGRPCRSTARLNRWRMVSGAWARPCSSRATGRSSQPGPNRSSQAWVKAGSSNAASTVARAALRRRARPRRADAAAQHVGVGAAPMGQATVA
jgi:hypothetical protein